MLPCGTFNESYGQDTAVIRTRLQWGLVVAGLILLFTLPLYSGGYLLGLINHISILVIVVLGLQIITGYCGLVSFGQAAFMAVGAYTSAILTMELGWSFWAALPLAGIAAGLVGIIGGAPALRIKGFYLALATLAVHYIVLFLIMHMDITGGTAGLHPPPPQIGNFAFDSDESMFYIIVPVMLLMTFFAKNLTRTKIGRAFMAIRDNDLAAEVMGVSLFYYKLLAFFIGCFFAGIAGSLLGHWWVTVAPEAFTITQALIYVGMIIVGGLGSISGVFFGVIFLRLLDEAVFMAAPMLSAAIPGVAMDIFASVSAVVFGVVIILFLIFEPRGLAHRWEIFKASYRLYPFTY